MAEPNRRLYISDFKTGYTYFGKVSFFTCENNQLSVALDNVDVYEYTSSNYLHSITHVKLSGPADGFHIEDVI